MRMRQEYILQVLTRTSRRLQAEASASDDVSDVVVVSHESDAHEVSRDPFETGYDVVHHDVTLNRDQVWVDDNLYIITNPVLEK